MKRKETVDDGVSISWSMSAVLHDDLQVLTTLDSEEIDDVVDIVHDIPELGQPARHGCILVLICYAAESTSLIITSFS